MNGPGTLLLRELFRHAGTWLANLRRAGRERKRQSVQALRRVITAARETAVYLRRVGDTGRRDYPTEARLAVLWTELGFALEDLGVGRLAKRCSITGKQWSRPGHYDEAFIHKADVSLERMERIAREILGEMTGKPGP